MCFFNTPKMQQAIAPTPPPPAPLPPPSPTMPQETASATQDQKRLQIANLKKGFASTIVNSGGAQGLTGKGPDLNTPAASALFPNSGKTTVGS